MANRCRHALRSTTMRRHLRPGEAKKRSARGSCGTASVRGARAEPAVARTLPVQPPGCPCISRSPLNRGAAGFRRRHRAHQVQGVRTEAGAARGRTVCREDAAMSSGSTAEFAHRDADHDRVRWISTRIFVVAAADGVARSRAALPCVPQHGLASEGATRSGSLRGGRVSSVDGWKQRQPDTEGRAATNLALHGDRSAEQRE